MFKGSITALITLLREDGALDEKGFEAFVDWQIQVRKRYEYITPAQRKERYGR